LTVEQCHSVISIIKGTCERAAANEEPTAWTKEDVAKLTKLEEAHTFRACCLTSQKDPSVIVGSNTENIDGAPAPSTVAAPKNVQDFFSSQQKKLLDKHKANRMDWCV